VNVTVENLAPCKKLVRVELEAQKVDETFESITRDFQKQASLPGFRPAKRRATCAAQIHKDIQERGQNESSSPIYRKAVEEQKLDVLGYPDIEEIQFAAARPCNCRHRRDRAGISAPEYKGLPVKTRGAHRHR